MGKSLQTTALCTLQAHGLNNHQAFLMNISIKGHNNNRQFVFINLHAVTLCFVPSLQSAELQQRSICVANEGTQLNLNLLQAKF